MGDYHSAHTGQIIDATISAVIAGKESGYTRGQS